MHKLASIGLAFVALPAITAAAVAQTGAAPAKVKVDASIKPAKGGTAKKPKPASLKIKATVNRESNSTLAGVTYGIPKSVRVSGKGFPKCSADSINNEGEGACPSKSKVGSGAATAFVGSTELNFSVNVFANGANGLVLSLTTVGGTDTAAVFPAKITKKSISFDIPENIQQPIPGAPAEGKFSNVTLVTANLNKVTYKGHTLVTRVGCFGGKDTVKVSLPLADNPSPPAKRTITGSDSAPCKK